MKAIAIITATFLLLDALCGFGILVYEMIIYEGYPYDTRYLIKNILRLLSEGLLVLFLILFATNSKN